MKRSHTFSSSAWIDAHSQCLRSIVRRRNIDVTPHRLDRPDEPFTWNLPRQEKFDDLWTIRSIGCIASGVCGGGAQCRRNGHRQRQAVQAAASRRSVGNRLPMHEAPRAVGHALDASAPSAARRLEVAADDRGAGQLVAAESATKVVSRALVVSSVQPRSAWRCSRKIHDSLINCATRPNQPPRMTMQSQLHRCSQFRPEWRATQVKDLAQRVISSVACAVELELPGSAGSHSGARPTWDCHRRRDSLVGAPAARRNCFA